jgi:hypothetical protein
MLATLLRRKTGGILFNEHTDEDGATVLWHACKLSLEGIVSKRLTAPYRSGPSPGLAEGEEPGQSGHGATSGGQLATERTLLRGGWLCGVGPHLTSLGPAPALVVSLHPV